MKHLENTELEQYIAGKLTPKRILEVDEHISGCSECREALKAIPAVRKSALDLGTALLGAGDCPEYEQLSAFVDNELNAEETKQIRSHLNLCEPCTHDVSRIAELRSHAAMRPVVTVGPGMSQKAAAVPVTPIWKRILAGAGVAAVVAFSAFMFHQTISMVPGRHGNPVVADRPITNPAAPDVKQPDSNTPPMVHTHEVANGNNSAPQTPNEPQKLAMIQDGDYQVTSDGGKVAYNGPRNALEARIAAAIDQKLKSGHVRPDRLATQQVALLRDGNAPATSLTAPKLVSPLGKILLSDKPTLRWSAVEMAESYQVTVVKQNGEAVCEEVTDGTSLTLPDSLTRGEVYKWWVKVRFSESDDWAKADRSAQGSFAVLSAENYGSIEKIRNEMPGSHLALGVAYETFGLGDEARAEYAKVRAANPHSSLAKKIR